MNFLFIISLKFILLWFDCIFWDATSSVGMKNKQIRLVLFWGVNNASLNASTAYPIIGLGAEEGD